MPPSKSRQAPPDDSEGSSTRDQKQANSTNSTNGKNRRVANGANAGSSLQNVANTKNNAASNVAVGTGASQDNMEWSKIESSTLHVYRHAYRLNTPSAFSNPHNELVLSRGIGKLSPTMARRKGRRRQSKEQLTHAVRKHFNGLGIQENEVVVDFLYKVHNMDKSFRMRFAPPKSR